jgi:hypothetical protein
MIIGDSSPRSHGAVGSIGRNLSIPDRILSLWEPARCFFWGSGFVSGEWIAPDHVSFIITMCL